MDLAGSAFPASIGVAIARNASVRRGVSIPLILAALLTACGEAPITAPPSPTAPSPLPSPVPQPPFTVSGVVLEHTMAGSRPLAGVRLRLRTWQPPGSFLDTVSDASGRYEVSGLQARETVTVAPSIEAEYRAPCPAGTSGLSGNSTVDVHVVSTALLSTAGAPASLPRTSIWVSGVVFERTPEGRRPVAGAAADLAVDDSDAFVMSTTLTDGSGRYLLCTVPPGVGTDQIAWVRVRKDRFRPVSRSIVMGMRFDVDDIELVSN